MRVSFHFLVLIDITKSLKMGLMLRVGYVSSFVNMLEGCVCVCVCHEVD